MLHFKQYLLAAAKGRHKACIIQTVPGVIILFNMIIHCKPINNIHFIYFHIFLLKVVLIFPQPHPLIPLDPIHYRTLHLSHPQY